MTLLDGSDVQLMGTAVTASGIDRSGPTQVPVTRYISPEWMAVENEKVWPKVWQIACSTDHVAEPGDFYEYRAGWLSILVVRGEDGVLRAFQNACRHRGNLICEGTGSGLSELRCPYHRWAWNMDGRLREVPSRKGFGRIDNDEFGLIPAQVDTWGPMVFVNLDLDAMPLDEWLEGIPEDVSWASIDDFRCNSLVVRPMPANWKVVSEGFSETYHIQGIHREMLGHIDDVDAPQKLWHRHGVSYQQYGVPSPRLGRNVPDQVVWDTWIQCIGNRIGLDSTQTYACPDVPEGKTIRDVIAERVVAHQASLGVDISHFDTAKATGASQYNLFPNATVLVWSDMINVLSTRPGLTPDECQFVSMNFHRVPPGAPRSQPVTADLPDSTDMGFVMNQDIGIMKTAQRGLHQPGLKHLTLSAEECRVINLHRNLDEWCSE
ncbi:MAG: (2Fe-2S)-binding protein [Acidimicrobiales bacterium]|nr:(2Fe-2S)-binding protein [Acidimicrobiales bacterium]